MELSEKAALLRCERCQPFLAKLHACPLLLNLPHDYLISEQTNNIDLLIDLMMVLMTIFEMLFIAGTIVAFVRQRNT